MRSGAQRRRLLRRRVPPRLRRRAASDGGGDGWTAGWRRWCSWLLLRWLCEDWSATAAWRRGLAAPSLVGRSPSQRCRGLGPAVGGLVAGRSGMSLSVLGPIAVVRGGTRVQVGSPQQRRVLA